MTLDVRGEHVAPKSTQRAIQARVPRKRVRRTTPIGRSQGLARTLVEPSRESSQTTHHRGTQPMKRVSTLMRAVAVAGGLTALPVTISMANGVEMNDARCEGGTCCFEVDSTCYPGSCSEKSCSEAQKYWKESGSCKDVGGT